MQGDYGWCGRSKHAYLKDKKTRTTLHSSLSGVVTVLKTAVVLVLVMGVASGAQAQKASASQARYLVRMVKDINATDGNSSWPSQFTGMNGTLFFVANDGVHGQELWKSDGTLAGTVLVRDSDPSSGFGFQRYLTAVNDMLFFRASDLDHGWELWKSDGTEAGTVLVKDIRPGPEDSLYRAGASAVANVGGTFFFVADDGIRGDTLWKSDGTPDGTVMVKDVRVSDTATEMIAIGDTLYFVGVDKYGGELWKSDGTEAGTVMVKDIYHAEQSSLPHQFADVNGTLFFVAYDGIHGGELWKSDGTEAGTVLVKDILASADESAIRWDERMVNVGGTLFFPANGGQGFELWKSNGTRAGTALVRDINPLTTCDESGSYPGSGSSPCSSWPSGLTQVDGTLFFAANDGSHGWELWKSDGTEAGTVLVKDIWPLEDRSSLDEYPRVMAGMNGLLFFAARDGREKELWQSDGTEAGTVLVRDINTFASSYPEELTPMDGTLFFRAHDGFHGKELWALSEACCQIFLPLVFSP